MPAGSDRSANDWDQPNRRMSGQYRCTLPGLKGYNGEGKDESGGQEGNEHR